MSAPAAKAKIVAVIDLSEGIRRLYETADADRSQPMLIVDRIDLTRDDLGLVGDDLIALAMATGVETPATLEVSQWRGGPVLSVGLGYDHLVTVAHDRRVPLVLAFDCRAGGSAQQT